MRRVATLTVLLVFATAANAAATCRDGVRIASGWDEPVRTKVIVCRAGKERVVRRASMGRRAGTQYTSAALVGGRLALARVVRRGARFTAAVELRTWPAERLRFRRTKVARKDPSPHVALAPSGTLAWAISGRLALRRTSGRTSLVAAKGAWEPTFDEDSTLRWGGSLEPRFFDTAPLPLDGDRCPVRTGYEPELDTADMRVTRRNYFKGSSYGDADQPDVLRACLKGSGRDVVVGNGGGGDSDSTFANVVAARAPFVVTSLISGNKYDGCAGAELLVFDVRTGALARRGGLGSGTVTATSQECVFDGLLPRKADPLVVTAGGTPAWLRDGVLRTFGADNAVAELDRGAITDLTADGTTVRWRSGGVPRATSL